MGYKYKYRYGYNSGGGSSSQTGLISVSSDQKIRVSSDNKIVVYKTAPFDASKYLTVNGSLVTLDGENITV